MHQVLVSENGPHAMTCGENCPDQRGVQEVKAAVEGKQHRNDKQQRKNR